MSDIERKVFGCLTGVAEAIAGASGGTIRIAENEADITNAEQLEAGTFLKLNDRRLGRALEVYAFTAKLGVEAAFAYFLEEVLLPLADEPRFAGFERLRATAVLLCGDAHRGEFGELLDSLKLDPPAEPV